MMSFSAQTLLILMMTNLFSFSLLLSVSYIKSTANAKVMKIYLYVFIYEFYSFSSYVQSLINSEVFKWHKVVSILFSHMDI